MHVKRTYALVALAVTLAAAAPLGARAQEAKIDSLEALIRGLEARLDSLMAALARGAQADSAAATAAAELEALRAAAEAAGAEQEPPDTTQTSRTRNLSILNPEISVTGDVVGTYTAPANERNRFTGVPREFEFGFEAALDPYTRTKIFVSYEEELEIAGLQLEEEGEEHGHSGFGIEEGYLYWVGLPANLGLKIGKFRQEIGLYNRWHTHALWEVDRPLPAVAFLGDDGLIQTGLAFGIPTLVTGPGTHVATLEITRSENEALFESANEISFLGNVRSFWDLSPSTYVQLGATGVYGENNDAEGPFKASLLALDFSFRWRPPGRALYRDFSLKGEWYFAKRDSGTSDLTGDGGYLQANFRLNRRWLAGLRGDYLDNYGAGGELYQLVPNITWWQSEWVYFRLQYNYVKPQEGGSSHTVLLQAVWAMGPHKHETY
ncbi:MAG: hypothetical protein JSW46_00280 [Gemmatimonadota bacterium]|nr:MAG: hypothetical protein JSW46_00280 [Gemmatimonadota bacterium]